MEVIANLVLSDATAAPRDESQPGFEPVVRCLREDLAQGRYAWGRTPLSPFMGGEAERSRWRSFSLFFLFNLSLRIGGSKRQGGLEGSMLYLGKDKD
jgi:hypothetical protein